MLTREKQTNLRQFPAGALSGTCRVMFVLPSAADTLTSNDFSTIYLPLELIRV